MGLGGNPRSLFSRHADDVDGGAFQPVKEPQHVVARHPVHPLHAALQQGFNQLKGGAMGSVRGTRRRRVETNPETPAGSPQRGPAKARRNWPQAAS